MWTDVTKGRQDSSGRSETQIWMSLKVMSLLKHCRCLAARDSFTHFFLNCASVAARVEAQIVLVSVIESRRHVWVRQGQGSVQAIDWWSAGAMVVCELGWSLLCSSEIQWDVMLECTNYFIDFSAVMFSLWLCRMTATASETGTMSTKWVFIRNTWQIVANMCCDCFENVCRTFSVAPASYISMFVWNLSSQNNQVGPVRMA